VETLDSASLRPILLVDDEPDLLEATRRRIEVALPEVEVHAFTDGRRALAALAGRSVGLAILDVDMPELSGLQLAERLREQRTDLPILFLTGTAKANMVPEYERVGAVAWLRKPVSGQVLLDTIAAHALRR
jgi:FixJ family two-component response regulator